MLDGAARLDGLFARTGELGMPAIAMTDHGNLHGAYDFYRKAKAARRQADHRHRGLPHPRHAAAASERKGVLAEAGGNDVAGGGAYTHMTMLGGDHRGHAQPVPALDRRLARGLLLQAPDGPRAARQQHGKGLIASTGCPSGEIQTRLRLGQYDEAPQGRRRASRTSSAGTTSSSS